MKRRTAWACAALLAAAGAAPAAEAQGLRDLALAWVLGDFRAPLVCTRDDVPRQALRRVRVVTLPRSARPAVRVTFYDLEAPPGTACSGFTRPEEPNVLGALDLVFDGRTRSDTGEADFRHALEREGGFRYRIQAGQLRSGPAGDAVDAFASHDYAGGSARFGAVPPGSDAARRLAAFHPRRSFTLEVEAEGAPSLFFELVELPPR
jgi:hypothetical protein